MHIFSKISSSALALCLALMMAACSGEDGSDGVSGVNGKDGVSGTDGKNGKCRSRTAKPS